jgi:hypothetical protein
MRTPSTLFIFLFSIIFCFGQEVKVLTPTLGNLVDLGPEKEAEFAKKQTRCEELWEQVERNGSFDALSKQDQIFLENCSETIESIYDIIGGGCSWYCAAGEDTNTASSFLKPFKNNDYSPNNIHDLSYKTAWIEGVAGYGIGENITYHFPPQNPRITEIIVVNGYVKSKKAWQENSRVKKLKMYIDNKPFAILNLEDCRNEQIFTFEPIGNSDRSDYEKLQNKPWWTIKFEILDVYKGDKYDDTAITEIYFDGIDAH